MNSYKNWRECLFQHLLGHYLIAQASETLPQWLSRLAKWEILKWIDQKVPLQKSYQALSLAFIYDGTSVGWGWDGGETERRETDREGSVCMAWMASGLMRVTACSLRVILRDAEHCSFWTLREGAGQKGQGLSHAQPCETAENRQEAKGYRRIQIVLLCPRPYKDLVPQGNFDILCVQSKTSRASDPIP